LSDYNRIKVLEFSKLDTENFFIGFNILVIEKLFPTLHDQAAAKRNDMEKEIKNKFEILKPEFNNLVSMRAAMKKEFDGNIENSTKLVKNWVNRMATIDDLQQKSTDVKLISGMRMGKQIDMENLKEFLTAKMNEYQEAGVEKEKELR
jgi:hypothetical protein